MSAGVCGCGAPVPAGQESCIGCAFEQGFDEARVVTRADEVYGPYAGTIRNRVAFCADYLGRITRTLAAGPSRHYIAEKAEDLRDAAVRLAGTCHDVEGWLAECGERFNSEIDGEQYVQECALPAGHAGEHRGEVRTPLADARKSADELAGTAVAMAEQMGWLAHRAPSGIPSAGELEEGLEPLLRELRRSLERLGSAVAALVASRPRDDAEEELVCHQCDFEAEGLEHLAEHRREWGH